MRRRDMEFPDNLRISERWSIRLHAWALLACGILLGWQLHRVFY